MEIIKNAIRVGNSAGVLLPRKWLNSQVKVVLEPLNIERDILEILLNEGILKDVLGVYLIGSYARNEQTIESDVDVLTITSNINKKINEKKYEIICVTGEELKNQLEKNILPILPMIKESRAIINESLIKDYITHPLTRKNLRFHIETSKSALNVIEEAIKISKEQKEGVSDNIVYSLVLRLREVYIVECLIKNKSWSNKELIKLIKEISGSEEAYHGYLRAKNNEDVRKDLKIQEAKNIYEHIKKKIKEQEKWAGKRK